MSIFILIIANTALSRTYEVGENKEYKNISDVPLEEIKAGDTVLIYYRDEPYREKWVITATGTKENPVLFKGVPDINGKLPVIDGDGAVTRKNLNFWSETRGIIKIGGSNNPADTTPAYITIENLEIRNAHIPYTFTGRNGITAYEKNSAAIFVEKGNNITIRNCVIHNNGNGIFVAHQSKNVTIEFNYIYGNGNVGSAYEHNTYTEADTIIYQFNKFGPLLDGADGNNLKDRSAGTIIRYNFIESGNRQLDLVDSSSSELIEKAYYRKTYVYGNVLIEPDNAGNSQILHYGGDSGNLDNYRKGELLFYNNTVISTRGGNTTLARLSSDDEEAYIINNIVYVTSSGNRLAILDSAGSAHLLNNWLPYGYKKSHSNSDAVVLDEGGNIVSSEPDFVDFLRGDFHLKNNSICIDKGYGLNNFSLLLPEYEYSEVTAYKKRFLDEKIDIGAFEFTKEMTDAGFDLVDSSITDSSILDVTDLFIEDTSDVNDVFPLDAGILDDMSFQDDFVNIEASKDIGGDIDVESSGCSCAMIR